MEIIYKKGNLVEAAEDAIAHGCNAQGVMRSGVAKAIRETFPLAYDAYNALHKHNNSGLSLGVAQYVQTKNKYIVNCITQEFYGRDGKQYVDYDAIRSCMKDMNQSFLSAQVESVALPKIGSGLGGGDWDIIAKIIEEEFVDIQPVVYEN